MSALRGIVPIVLACVGEVIPIVGAIIAAVVAPVAACIAVLEIDNRVGDAKN